MSGDAELLALSRGAGHGKNAVEQLNHLQLLIRNKLDGLLHGDYLGLLPGPGTEPGESREYRPGDDVRRMDWPVTARTTTPHVRTTIADRELETWMAVDLSASLDFGTAKCLKRDLAIAAVAAIAHLTVRGGNRIGAVLGAGDRPVVVPAAPGHAGAQVLLRKTAALRPELPKVGGWGRRRRTGPGRTDLSALIDKLHRPPRRRGFAVVVSDFLADDEWERPIRKLAVRHDVLAIEIVDPRELSLPDVGVVEFMDPETGAVVEVETGDANFRRRYEEAATRQRDEIAAALRRAGAARLRLSTDSDWLRDIVRFVASQRHARTRGTTR
ncbi:MAG TPA: DUF58 domain-containing protein [Candidatus Stackebrandtia excrementipullorum]|nr:DUF58 domain-containing protein [Candidatus Stackebrandtia excrementipullorum]